MSVYEKMTALADAIREKTGGTEKLSIDQMTADVAALQIGGGEKWIGDGNTHLWIHLEEGRTSPMLGIGVNGTVTVDWGDGTTPDVLTGTSESTTAFTPNHNYATAGDYIITLTVDGTASFTSSNSILVNDATAGTLNTAYRNALKKAEIGARLSVGNQAFSGCYSLEAVNIPEGVTSIGKNTFSNCSSLEAVNIPESVTSIADYAFNGCRSLTYVNIPEGVTSIGGYAFRDCYTLISVNIPESVTSIVGDAFNSCRCLDSVYIPKGVTSIGSMTFYDCYCVRYYDFSDHTAVPTLSNSNAFNGINANCEVRVPAALYDEWIAATNWTKYASQIVAV